MDAIIILIIAVAALAVVALFFLLWGRGILFLGAMAFAFSAIVSGGAVFWVLSALCLIGMFVLRNQ